MSAHGRSGKNDWKFTTCTTGMCGISGYRVWRPFIAFNAATTENPIQKIGFLSSSPVWFTRSMGAWSTGYANFSCCVHGLRNRSTMPPITMKTANTKSVQMASGLIQGPMSAGSNTDSCPT